MARHPLREFHVEIQENPYGGDVSSTVYNDADRARGQAARFLLRARILLARGRLNQEGFLHPCHTTIHFQGRIKALDEIRPEGFWVLALDENYPAIKKVDSMRRTLSFLNVAKARGMEEKPVWRSERATVYSTKGEKSERRIEPVLRAGENGRGFEATTPSLFSLTSFSQIQ